MVCLLTILSLPIVFSLEYSCNPYSCNSNYPGDAYCDESCMTEVCNFDSASTSSDPFTNLKSGDCGFVNCISNSSCTEALLRNSVCDEACNIYQCGYDLGSCGFCSKDCKKTMLGNGKCDSDCNNAACWYDYNDCGWCAEGCFKEMMNDGKCQPECETPECDYDMYDCDVKFCASGCSDDKLHNSECDMECNNEACNYDKLQCMCAAGCTESVRSSSTCQSACNTASCNWHDGKCNNCAPGCEYNMIGNGVCDQACYNDACYNDITDCECAPGCRLSDYMFDFCSDECMDLRCDAFTQVQNCPDVNKKKQNYYIQMLTEEFELRFSKEMCFESDDDCSEEDLADHKKEPWEYDEQCQTVECTFLRPYYNDNSECHEDCAVCVDDETCLECKPPKIQHFRDCVDRCPADYEAISVSFLDHQVCIKTRDETNFINPAKIYVSSSSGVGSGKLEDPYNSLSRAFLRVEYQFTEIILFEGTYDLLLHNSIIIHDVHPENPLLRLDEDKEVLPFIYIGIRAATCEEYGEPEDCYKSRPIIKPKNMVKILANSYTFRISGLDFDGGDLVCNNVQNCPCSESVCNYCVQTEGSSMLQYDDQYNLITVQNYKKDMCSVFKDFVFLESVSDSEVAISDVEFRNFRMGENNLININDSSLYLRNVNFYNIIPGRFENMAVIHIERLGGYSQYFVYEGGMVSLLNNGYELLDDTVLSGFLIARKIDTILIQSVTFDFNISYEGKNRSLSEGFGCLIYIENAKNTVYLYDLVLSNNFVNYGLIYIIVTSLEFLESDYSANIFTLTNIHLKNIQISNTSCSFHCIIYYNTFFLQNIELSDISITDSVSIENAMIEFKYTKSLTSLEMTGGYKQIIKGSRDSKYISPRYLKIKYLTIENAFFSVALLDIENFANIEINFMNITNCGDFDQDLSDDIVDEYTFDDFIAKSYYIKKGYPEDINTECDNIIHIKRSYAISWDQGRFSSNKCKKLNSNSNLAISSSYGNVIISNVEFSDISASSSLSNAIYISDHDNSAISIFDCQFRDIINSSGTGAIRISGVYTVNLYSNTLSNISGSSYGAVFIESSSLIVKDCVFDNIESQNDSGGAIAYIGNDLKNLSYLNITDSQFNRCKIPKAYGCIAIDRASTAYQLELIMINLAFTESTGESAGIYIKETVVISEADISDVVVSGSNSYSTGPIYLRHSSGMLKVMNCRFVSNRGYNCGVFTEFSKEGKLLYLENITITGNTCTANSIYLFTKSANTSAQLLKLTVSSNTGSGLEISKMNVSDASSVYEKNHSGISLSNQAIVYFDTVKITENKNSYTAGGVLLVSASRFTCTNCVISNNQGWEGGGLKAEQNSYFTISKTVFQSNHALASGSAIFILGSTAASTIEDTQIITNTSVKDMVISILTGKLTISRSTIKENKSISGNPTLLSYASDITIRDSIFSDQTFTSSGFIYLNSGSLGIIENSKFYNLESEGSPGALYIFASQCTVTNSEFSNINSYGSGGAILIQSKSKVTIQASSFTDVNAYSFGGVIFAQDSELTILSITTSNFKNSGIYGVSLSSLSIQASEFVNGESFEEGGAIFCTDCIGVVISDCTFQNNEADMNGGAIYLYGNKDNGDNNSATISNCKFIENTANKGAGIALTQVIGSILNSEFEGNRAETNGGGIDLSCSESEECEYTVRNCKFVSNYADTQGGAISWDDKKPVFEDLEFDNNNSTYGNDIASYPIKMQAYSNNQTIPYQRRLESSQYYPIAYKISDVAPGQKLSVVIVIVIVDEYGNIDYSDNHSSAEISEFDVDTTVLSGTTKVLAKSGTYTFDDLTIQYEPGGTTYLKVTSEAINPKKKEGSGDTNSYYNTVYIEVSFRLCEIGETDSGRECKICEQGTYSLDPSNPCSECPSEATCMGSYTMYPKKGYWRTTKFTDTFYECPNSDACLGSNEMTSYTGVCDDGYLGNLCQACDNGYSRTSENQCGACPEATANAVRLVGIIVLMILVCVVMVKTTFRSAYVPSSLHSIYIKIFTNYLQLVMITTQFKLEWPDLVLEFFSIQKQSGAVTDQVFSVDCYLTDGSSEAYKDVYFQKLIVLALVPVILWFFSFAFWGIMAQKNQDRTYLRKEMIATDVILFFLVHPDITRSSFALFSCMEIEDKGYYLLDNLDIECWTGKHYLYSMTLALPCIIVWVLGTPALVLYYMYKHRLNLLEIDNRLRFGFLYTGYRNKKFYWEFFILYRKILIICISVFLTTISIEIQALSALLLLIASLYAQMKTRPFTHKILNIMEARGILAANVTIYCGLFYLTNALDEATKYFFFCVILLVNLYFLSYWLYHLTHEGWKILKKNVGFFRRRYDHDDGYPDFLREPAVAKKVTFDGDQVKCTLVESIIQDKFSQDCPHKIIDLYKEFVPAKLRLEDLPDFSSRKLSDIEALSSFYLDITDRSDISCPQTLSELNIRSPSFDLDENEEIAEET